MSFGNKPAPQRRQTRPAGPAPARRPWAGWSLLTVAALAAVSVGFGAAGCGSGGGSSNPSPSPSAAANVTTVTGRIVDGNNASQPVAGAIVSLGGKSQATAADGSFTLTFGSQALAAGSLTISIPSGSYYNILRTSTGVCSTSLSVPVGAVAAGQTANVGTVTVYDQSQQSPPPAPCLGP